jgi:hypothetical protein
MIDKQLSEHANFLITPNDQILMGVDECEALSKLAENKRVVEIGSFRGGSAKAMLPQCVSLVCIDPHEDIWWHHDKDNYPSEPDCRGKDVQADFFKNTDEFKEKMTYIQKYSQDAINDLPVDECDLLFVDGDHSFEACKRDLELFVPKLNPKWVACHDYCLDFSGVIAACQLFFKRMPDYLVRTLGVWKLC